MPPKMVWWSLTVCALCFFSSVPGRADDQAAKEPENAVAVNLIRMIDSSILNFISPGTVEIPLALEYQHSSGSHFTRFVAVTIIYSAKSGNSTFSFEQIYEADWHPFNQGMNGWFFGAFLDTSFVDFETSSGSFASDLIIGLGLAIGYELALANSLFLEFSGGAGVGIGYNSGSFGSVIVPAFPYRVDVALGYRF